MEDTTNTANEAGWGPHSPDVPEQKKSWNHEAYQDGPAKDPNEDSDRKAKLEVRRTGLFAFSNVEQIKEKVRSAQLQKDPYDVRNFYHETGFFQTIARHSYFENATLAVIVINAFWISVDTDGNTADTIIDAEPMYIVADSLFFGYFFVELVIRFMAFKNKMNCFRDAWFCFDTALVTLYAFDPFTIGIMAAASGGGGLNLPTAILRLFRLARLSRLVRMLRSLPELMIMIKGMLSAAASVGYTLGLLMVITYVFAIALRNLVPTGDDNTLANANGPNEDTPGYFESVPETMHHLIIYATFLDNLADFVLQIKAESTVCLIFVWVYIALASMTVMNMLIGVLCEVISAVAEEEKESMMVDKVKEKFGDLVERLDSNQDGVLSWEEFQKILEFPEALSALESVNVDAESLIELAEDFFFDDGEKPCAITFEQFMLLVLDIRGGQQATVKDVMTMGKRFSAKFIGVKTRMDGLDQKICSIDSKLDKLLAGC